ncbi:MAG: hypothetical protein AB7I42_25960 [Bradyrhizobium sp.]|uniref:hypothetical protein n=1 Tax=Bradyrhizobium sp. TaxID=376 RepID=UPI003D11903A
MGASSERIRPCLLERLRSIFGSLGKLCRTLGVPDSYPVKWRKCEHIPERWALDIHRLQVRDQWGQITAMTVLYEAEEVRLRKMRELNSTD